MGSAFSSANVYGSSFAVEAVINGIVAGTCGT